jgi:MFS transporter, DHA1 family, solute carrier family 18 (vesicular amine transporter), member 1/2
MISKFRESKTVVLLVSCLAVFTDMVIYGVIMPIMKEIIKQYPDYSENDIIFGQAALPAFYAAGLLVFTPVFSSLSDRYKSRKVPMLLGQLLLAFSTLLFAFANSFVTCLLARFLQGIAGAATWVVGMAMLVDVFNGPELGFYMGIVFGCHNLGFFLGPLIGGFLHDSLGLRAPFYVCTVLALIDFLGRMLLKESAPTCSKIDKLTNSNESGLSMIQLAKKPEIVLLNIVIVLKAASFSSIESMLEVHLYEHFGSSPSETSLVFLAFILPSIIAVIVIGWISGRIRRYLIISLGLILHPISGPLITSSKNIYHVVGGGILFGISTSIFGSPVSPELAEIVKSYGGSSYARVYGILNISYSFGILIGPSLVAYFTRKTNFMSAMVGLSLMPLIYAPIFYSLMKSLYLTRQLRLNKLSTFESTPITP